jgi:hypothetical protein
LTKINRDAVISMHAAEPCGDLHSTLTIVSRPIQCRNAIEQSDGEWNKGLFKASDHS